MVAKNDLKIHLRKVLSPRVDTSTTWRAWENGSIKARHEEALSPRTKVGTNGNNYSRE